MAKKIALLIGVSEYGAGIPPLLSALNDVEAMERVLQNPNLGNFAQVQRLLNPDTVAMRIAIQKLFRNASKEDLLLFFFSGHGITNDDNHLYLATRNTAKDDFEATAVDANFIQTQSKNCYSKRQVLILDACYSGAFASGWHTKSTGVDIIKKQLGAEGRVVLTSSGVTQTSFTQEGATLSLYTQYLVEGIETGAADTNNDGNIHVHELHDYAKSRVQAVKRNMTPDIILDKEGYNILLAYAPKKLQLKTFQFETAQINKNGTGINRITKSAEYFAQDLGNGVLLEMVHIPGGTFIMGSPKNEEGYFESQSPQHHVTVPSFFMGKYLVTQKQWRLVAALPKVKIDLVSDPSCFKGDNLPVERVSWNDAREFCDRLSRMANKTYRLPSEAEWEYACRGGTTTPFYCGETISTDLANYNGNYTYGQGQKGQYRGKTTEVGIFPANPFGLYDMCGNVWEWCEDDWQENYINAPKDGSAWTSLSVNEKLLRGGSWDYYPEYCRSAFRLFNDAGFDYFLYGFRVVCGAAWTH
ncbi:SUMF1/EgtB/PvdO family nonheme iron enzyme [Aphanizomenon sp. CS-733/32]|uniref:caspase, EACC1-associated type n=1 Tax=Aphanizomenon sp. CS-733/32 TaxID=3021715 RepID=UPI00232DBD9E|nr:SUMF1/EgtB/PvdO family nonheme iron enzyme [Aphanizomenon sp. CS-733/32]MDB9307345.1 SUMF1/EgtB/PvdO family nonheme iron enzyme [Aphanizomenon sp. CS-733/32]